LLAAVVQVKAAAAVQQVVIQTDLQAVQAAV
jgi:hypothetical protein